MLPIILLLNLIICFTDAKSSPKPGLEDVENLEEKFESRLRDMEKRLEEMETRLESKDKEMERMQQKMQMEEFLRKEIASNFSNAALTVSKPSLRDLPIVAISARKSSAIESAQTVTFDAFLANFNGNFDLHSGVFTCFTPGLYTVSFSAFVDIGPNHDNIELSLYINDREVPASKAVLGQALNPQSNMWVTVSRMLIIHMNAGDNLDLRISNGDWDHGNGNYVSDVTLNIELIGGEE